MGGSADGLGEELEQGVARAAALIVEAAYPVALAGAGMSVESGIPPFRGPDGLWTRYGEPTSLSYQGFLKDPEEWWRVRLRDEVQPGNPTYVLKQAVDAAGPNPGHYALAELERLGKLRYLITQNVDDLHHRAGSVNMAEIHGNRTLLRCLECSLRLPRARYPVNQVPPSCAECGGLIKIDSVMFGEPIPRDVMAACLEQASRCDCMLLIGTSGTVHPAAGLPIAARERGAVLVEVNPRPSSLTPMADLVLSGASGEVLPRLVARVKEMMGQ